MEKTVVFIYVKNTEIKAISFDNAKEIKDELIKDGWVHTTTLDVCVWIQYLCNKCDKDDLFDEIRSLQFVDKHF